ncbi:MAG: DNA methyltransferase [Halobacteriovoraceae bacterium]|jgi:adenine-specific DNA-methyltransferase|nr:DNA methyltransferase [Halobacteriovoraceae bacterium]
MQIEILENGINSAEILKSMPTTRFQGSKRKLINDIAPYLEELEFTTCLDAFGGTGSITHLLSRMGKKAQFNDIMPSNQVMAKALYSSGDVKIDEDLIASLFKKKANKKYKTTIQDIYKGIYYLDSENEEIDMFCQNVMDIDDEILQSEAYYLLFQSLLSKRPYNLFHRANLHMRTKEVTRSFGNKTTWDKPIIEHMLKFFKELKKCRVSERKYKVKFSNKDAFKIKNNFDLIYIDTPYAKGKGTQESNYFNFYHFLDALINYDEIPNMVSEEFKHKPVYSAKKLWYEQENISEAFEALFEHFEDSKLVISYRDDGYPSPETLIGMLEKRYSSVRLVDLADYKYVLSTQKKNTKEILIIAE